jgi:hypothetical protein
MVTKARVAAPAEAVLARTSSNKKMLVMIFLNLKSSFSALGKSYSTAIPPMMQKGQERGQYL